MRSISFSAIFILLLSATAALADATIPTKDITGAKDGLMKRYEGSFIVDYQHQSFTDFKIPLSPLVKTGKTDSMNNNLYAPQQEKALEGALTRITYVLPADRSPLEVLRNYQDEVKKAGGAMLFECKGEECGGDSTRTSSGGGGDSSLMMYFLVEKDVKAPSFSNGACALTAHLTDQRFFDARLPQASGDVYVAVHTYQLNDDLYCKALSGRTIAVVHILETTQREQKMVTVTAAEMGSSIGSAGHIALYGIYFDTDKSDIKPNSTPTLQEIAKLLTGQPKLSVLIVGHTDNQGNFDYNIELSKKRAQAVVSALSTTYKIDAKRLRAGGVGMMAPAATNDTEQGRAKNRRVELVKLN